MNIEIVPFQSKDYYQSLAVRHKVLRQPLGLHFDTKPLEVEFSDVHLVAKQGAQVVGTMIMSMADEGAKMRQVAVLPEYQSLGIGTKMVAKFESEVQMRGVNRVVLHARENAIEFYTKLGYSVVGEWFQEVGIPHKKMIKSL